MLGDMQLSELTALEELLARWANLVERLGDQDSTLRIRKLISEVNSETRRVKHENARYERFHPAVNR